ncbi:MAG TPA: type II toxin-antitoxin system RelB/DinJ family antitoxin [Stellaceae bacterium]|nr:type II toxin-antitoxin system RelB/DinJ family antitoxin [Stellaceae bacterium]
MSKSETVRARVEPELKRDAEAILKKIGLTPSEAITLFLTQVKLADGLPFPLRVPNRRTRQAIREAHAGDHVETFDSVDAWAKKARLR